MDFKPLYRPSIDYYTKSGSGINKETWKYTYAHDLTTIKGPEQTQVIHFVPQGTSSGSHYVDGLVESTDVTDSNTNTFLESTRYTYAFRKLAERQAIGSDPQNHTIWIVPYQSEKTSEAFFSTTNSDPIITNTYEYNSHGLVTKEALGSINGQSQIVTKGYFDKDYKDSDNTLHHLIAQTVNTVSDNESVVDSSRSVINDLGYATSSTHNGVTTTYTYGSDGNLTTQTNALGSTTHYEDYFAGFARKVTDALGHVGSYTVNPDGTVASYTDPESHTSSFSYDYLGRVTKVTMPNKDVYTNVYSLAGGAQTTKTTHGSAVQTTTYNAFGKPSSVTITAPSVPTYTQTHQYDAIGREVFTSYPGDTKGTATTYDGLGRVTATNWPVSDPEQTGNYSTSTSYPSWDKVEHTDSNGNETNVTSYLVGSPSNNLGAVETDIPTSAGEQVTTIARDAMGRMLSVSQDGWTRSYHYDPHFWVSDIDNPETGNTHYDYDAIGEVIASHVGDSGSTTHHYDKLGNLIETDYPDGRVDSFTYTPTGKKASAVVSGTAIPNRWSYTFDELDNLKAAALTVGGQTMAFSYDYDSHGFMSAAHYADGTAVEYAPDALGRPTKGGEWVNNVDYLADGHEKSFTDASGVTTSYAINDRHMVQSINFSSLVNLNNAANNVTVSYDYDGNTNITQVTDTRPNHNRSYQYDGADWLVSGTVDGQAMSVNYDPTGNITKKTYGSTVLNYQYDGQNRLQDVTGTVAGALAKPLDGHDLSEHFTYDSYGDITSRDGSGSGLTYNDAKELIHAVGTNPATGQSYDLHYFYDAMGNRVAVEDGGKTHFEVFNSKNQMLYKQDSSNVTNYLYLNGRKIAESTHALGMQATPQTSQFFHNDLQGSVILKSTFNGNIVDPSGNGQSYLPFGAELNPSIYTDTLTGNVGEHIGFINKPYNSASGLAYFGARYYDPLLGRFLGVDPVGYVGGSTSFNGYVYSNNNPIRYQDPDGCFSINPEEISMGFVVGGLGGILAYGVTTNKHDWSFHEAVNAGLSGAVAGAVSTAVIGVANAPFAGYAAGTAAADNVLLGGSTGAILSGMMGDAQGAMSTFVNSYAAPMAEDMAGMLTGNTFSGRLAANTAGNVAASGMSTMGGNGASSVSVTSSPSVNGSGQVPSIGSAQKPHPVEITATYNRYTGLGSAASVSQSALSASSTSSSQSSSASVSQSSKEKSKSSSAGTDHGGGAGADAVANGNKATG